MNETFVNKVMHAASGGRDLPFSIYTSKNAQTLHNVPFVKPTLVCVLKGQKRIGIHGDLVCDPGSYIFLSNSARTQIRNIPILDRYVALLIEFEHSDFSEIKASKQSAANYFTDVLDSRLESCIEQLVEQSYWAPKQLWHFRRKEIIFLLQLQGHSAVLAAASHPKTSQRVHDLILSNLEQEISFDKVAKALAMSESTIRRRLHDEGTSFQELKDQARLGIALHLIQTTTYSIGRVAGECGYQSQSRFTERFKTRFKMTPSELRLCQLTE